MTDQELLEIESALAQYRSALREVGNTANLQAATEEVLVVATGLVAEVRRLNGLIERSRTKFVWKSNASWSWGLYSKDGCFDTVEMRQTERGTLWSNTFYRGYFDTLDEARKWVENRLRDSGIIKPIDVVEVAK